MHNLQTIKNNSKEVMKNFPSGAGITYIGDKDTKLVGHACFAGLKTYIDGSDKVYYLIGYYPDKIDYIKMKRSISDVFSRYLKIVWHNSGYKACKIIEISKKREFPDSYLWLTSINLLFVMLRCMDREYSYNIKLWGGKTKIENLHTLLTFSYTERKMYGHGVNDYFYSSSTGYSAARNINSEVTIKRIKHFLEVLKMAFGKPNPKIDKFANKNGHFKDANYVGQTVLFTNLCSILDVDNVDKIK